MIALRRFALPLAIAAAIAVPWSSLRADEKLDALIAEIAQEEIDAGRTVGISIGVARGDEVLHLKGYGLADIENSVPASAESVYRIGSITKMFTAAAVLLLIEDGKMGLDDALTQYFPDYPAPGDKVTIRHLLNHTSGIVSFTDLPGRRAILRNDMKHEEIVASFRDKPFKFAPGERYQYCNSGYLLLGMIIEQLTEMNYAEFLNQRIFQPLELNKTLYDRHATIVPHRASGYSVWGKKQFNAPFISMTQPFAAGALASDAGDLMRWSRALMRDEVLTAESFALMTTPGTLNDDKRTRYGFGCFVEKLDGHQVVRHGGGIPGFVTELVFFPQSELCVVVLTNTMTTKPRELADRIARSLLAKE